MLKGPCCELARRSSAGAVLRHEAAVLRPVLRIRYRAARLDAALSPERPVASWALPSGVVSRTRSLQRRRACAGSSRAPAFELCTRPRPLAIRLAVTRACLSCRDRPCRKTDRDRLLVDTFRHRDRDRQRCTEMHTEAD